MYGNSPGTTKAGIDPSEFGFRQMTSTQKPHKQLDNLMTVTRNQNRQVAMYKTVYPDSYRRNDRIAVLHGLVLFPEENRSVSR